MVWSTRFFLASDCIRYGTRKGGENLVLRLSVPHPPPIFWEIAFLVANRPRVAVAFAVQALVYISFNYSWILKEASHDAGAQACDC